jgi:hypothetical protein
MNGRNSSQTAEPLARRDAENGAEASLVPSAAVAAVTEVPRRPGAALRPVSVPVYLFGAASGIVLLLTLFEPVIGGGLSAAGRLLFFALHFFPAFGLAWILSGPAFDLNLARRLPAWATLAAVGFAVGLALAPWSVLLEAMFGVVELDEVGSGTERVALSWADWRRELAEDLLVVPLAAAAVWVAVNAAIVWRLNLQTGAPESHLPGIVPMADPPPVAAQSGSIFQRLPVRLGRDVLYVEAQEHYLRVVTSRGEQLLLRGLASAVRDLEQSGQAGIQVHRSYWVAWRHVERVVADSTGGYCELTGGLRIPVSRRRARSVREAFDARTGVGLPSI